MKKLTKAKKKAIKFKALTTSVVVLVALVAVMAVGVVSADSGSFWSKVAEIVGVKIADKVEVPDFDLDVEIGEVEEEPMFGVHGRSGVSLARVDLNTNSSTLATLLNSSTKDRFITRVVLRVPSSTSYHNIPLILDFTTSSDAFTSTTPIRYDGFVMATSTNLGTIYATSTSAIVPPNTGPGISFTRGQIWGASQYFNAQLNQAVSTTDGEFFVEYYEIN